MTPDDAYALLASALKDFVPPCNGQEVFTSSALTDLERAVCASICAGCPITHPCHAYAVAANAEGFWAGVDRNPKRKRDSSTTASGGTSRQPSKGRTS